MESLRRYILAAASLIVIGTSNVAVAPSYGQLRAGLTGGLNVASISDRSRSFESRSRSLFGVFLEYEVSERLVVGVGPVISQKGGQDDLKQFSPPSIAIDPETGQWSEVYGEIVQEVLFELHYLDLPLTFKYFVLAGKTRPFVMVGSWISLKLNAKRSINTYVDRYFVNASGIRREQTQFPPEVDTIKNAVNNLDAGISGGIGVQTELSGAAIFGVVNYAYGLTNIVSDRAMLGPKMMNRGIQFLAGISIPLARPK